MSNIKNLGLHAKKGYKQTAEERLASSLSKIGRPSGMKGKKHSEETKRKTSLALKGKPSNNPFKSGEKHPMWKGGITSNMGEYQKGRNKNLSAEQRKYISWLKNKRNRVVKRLREAGSSHTFGDWETLKAQYNWTCPCCKRMEPEIKLTEDHIISLSKGGSDNIENIQPLCRSCNSKKYNKPIEKYEK